MAATCVATGATVNALGGSGCALVQAAISTSPPATLPNSVRAERTRMWRSLCTRHLLSRGSSTYIQHPCGIDSTSQLIPLEGPTRGGEGDSAEGRRSIGYPPRLIVRNVGGNRASVGRRK